MTSNETAVTGNLRFSELTLFPWVHSELNRGPTRVVSLSESKLFNEALTFDAFDALKDVKMTLGRFGLECSVPILNSMLPEVTEMQEKRETSDFKDEELMRWASREQLRLADELVRVLGEAVRVRVECQSHYCSRCITAFLDSASDSALDPASSTKQRSLNCVDVLDLGQSDLQRFLRSEETLEQANGRVLRAASFEGCVDGFHGCDSSASIDGETKVENFCNICRRYNCCRDACDDSRLKCTTDSEGKDNLCVDCRCGYGWRNPFCKDSRRIESCTCVLSDRTGSVALLDARSDVFGADDSSVCPHAKVAVLFSGGVDSLVIAALADK